MKINIPFRIALFIAKTSVLFFVAIAAAAANADVFKSLLIKSSKENVPLLGYNLGRPQDIEKPRGGEALIAEKQYGINFDFLGIACCDNKSGKLPSTTAWAQTLSAIHAKYIGQSNVIEIYFPISIPSATCKNLGPKCKDTASVASLFSENGLSQNGSKLIKHMAKIIEEASKVSGTVLVRPFHEANGSWFWWGADMISKTQYSILWRSLQDIVSVEAQRKVVWIYSVDAGGDINMAKLLLPEAVDVIGIDYYGALGDDGAANIKKLDSLYKWAVKTGHLVALSELGARMTKKSPQCINWIRAFDYQKSNLPLISYIQIWGGGYGLLAQSDPAKFSAWLKNKPTKISVDWFDRCQKKREQ